MSNPTNLGVCLERQYMQSIRFMYPCDCGCNMPFVCVSEEKRQDDRRAEKLAKVESHLIPYGQAICYWCLRLQYCSSKSGKIKKHTCDAL